MDIVEENKSIVISGESVAPGEEKLLHISIDRLPTGTLIDIPVYVFNAKKSGPTILLQAGLHGDEINGIEILRRMLQEKQFKLKKGAVIVVPLLNVFGFIHFSRDVPDGKDVNRSFPGSTKGSLASRIAYHYTKEILPQITIGVDLHTGGSQRHNFPQVRYTEEDEMSRALAKIFDAPFMFSSRLIFGSFRKASAKNGIATIVYEAGESMRFDDFSIAAGIQGIRNILLYFKMIAKTKAENLEEDTSIHLSQRKWLRAPTAGMFIPKVVNGSSIEKKQVLGIVTDTYANYKREIKAPYDGYLFCVNHQAVVNQGDALFHIGK